MTLTLSLSSDVEARLRDYAARSGKDVPTLIREAIEEKLTVAPPAPVDAGTIPFDQWILKFNEWIASHKPVQHFVDDSRESIYEVRGE